MTSGPKGSSTYGDSSHPHAVTAADGGYSASYDASGNMTCRATSSATSCSGASPTGQQLSYDPEGRLTSWQNQANVPSQIVNYLYDGEGHRVAMQSNVSGTSTLTSYIGSIEEVQTSGSTTQTSTFYAVGSKRMAADVNGTFYYFGYDALGSQVAVLDGSGNLVGAQLYGPYGVSRYTTGTIPTSIGFTGQQSDSVTGLDYYGARYYDALVGVFISADSVQGNVQGMEPYAYVGGNPETDVDPSGNLRYDPATGEVAIPQSNGTYEITGYNSGENGTFDSSVSYTPVVFNPHYFWPTPARPRPTPTRRAAARPSHHISGKKVAKVASAALSPGLLNLAQKLVQGNERLKTDYGSDQWKVLHAERGTDIVKDDSGGVYTDRWYLTFDDGEGSKVTMSLNLNPRAGPADDPWDMKHIHFSSNQPDPGKWGEKDGWARSTDGLDPGASENPGDEDQMSLFAKLMLLTEEDPAIDADE